MNIDIHKINRRISEVDAVIAAKLSLLKCHYSDLTELEKIPFRVMQAELLLGISKTE